MSSSRKDWQDVNVDSLFDSKKKSQYFRELNKGMNSIKAFLDDIDSEVLEMNELPGKLNESAEYYFSTFMDYYKGLLLTLQVYDGQPDSEVDDYANEVLNWVEGCLNNKPINNHLGFIDTYTAIKCFGRRGLREKDVKTVSRIPFSSIVEKVLKDAKTHQKILDEIRKFSSELTVSNYARIYGRGFEKFNRSSQRWLILGFALAGVFGLAISFVDWDVFLPTETISEHGVPTYYISNIILKTLLLGVLLYLIGFSFKQYAVNKHNSVVNMQRQNAMNSFKLFIESIDEKDKSTRYTLMEILGKAIYEHVSTGFISEKGQQVNSSLVEITKMLGSNRQE